MAVQEQKQQDHTWYVRAFNIDKPAGKRVRHSIPPLNSNNNNNISNNKK